MPSVVVPLEAVGQQANAAALAGAGGALVVPQAEAGRLPGVVAGLASDAGRLAEMSAAASASAMPDAAGVVAEAILEAVHG